MTVDMIRCLIEKSDVRALRAFRHGKAKIEISRFKGLGEMLPAQLKETTMDPERRGLLRVVVLAEEREGTSDSVERLMGNRPEARFAFIQERAAFAAAAELLVV